MHESPPRRVYASMARSATQTIAPPLLAQAMIEYESTQATLIFDGFTRFDRLDRTLVVGSHGAIRSDGPTTEHQRVELDDGRRHRPAAAQRRLVPRRLSRHDGRAAVGDRREARTHATVRATTWQASRSASRRWPAPNAANREAGNRAAVAGKY